MSSQSANPPITFQTVEDEALWEHRKYQEFGLQEMDDIMPVSLTVPIHPIFARHNWRESTNMTDEMHIEIEPALRLASKFLSLPCIVRYLSKLAVGPVMWDGIRGRYYVLDPTEPAADVMRRTQEILVELAPYVLLSIGQVVRLDSHGWRCGGETNFSSARVPDWETLPSPAFAAWPQPLLCTHRNQLDLSEAWGDYLRLFAKNDRLNFRGQHARCMLFLAITLTHEVSHALSFMRFRSLELTPGGRSWSMPVAYDFDEKYTEEGFGLEKVLFPDMWISTLPSHPMPPYCGLWTQPWHQLSLRENGAIVNFWGRPATGLPTSWICQFMQQRFWDWVDVAGWENVPRHQTRLRVVNYQDGRRQFIEDGQMGECIMTIRHPELD